MLKKIKEYTYIALGVIMVSIGIHFFLLPSDLALGGATGLALVLQKITGIDVGALLVIVNMVLFIIGFLLIGNKFGVKTVIASLSLSFLVWALERIAPVSAPIMEEKFMNLIVAVLFYGVGAGLVLNQSASTGGSDIIAKLLYKYFGLNLGRGCLLTDFIITLMVGFFYGFHTAIYSLVGVIMDGFIIDATIGGLNSSRYLIIFSVQWEAICEYLVSTGRSASIYEAVGAYSKESKKVIHTVVSKREFIRIKKLVLTLDPDAFIIISNANEIYGWHWKGIDD